jgi:hypothetical protein
MLAFFVDGFLEGMGRVRAGDASRYAMSSGIY